MLPNWFDVHALEDLVAAAAVLCALGLVLVLARVRHLTTKLLLALVLIAAVSGLAYYREGPLKDCQAQGSCHFFKSNLPLSGTQVRASK